MTKWTFWEWVAYAALFVAATIIAADQAIKMAPDVRDRLEILIANPVWAFSPISLILLATGIFIGRELEKRKAIRGGTQLNKNPSAQLPAPIVTRVNDGSVQRVLVNIPPEYLMKFFEDHTEIQAARLAEPYIGKWIKISAIVFNVSAQENIRGGKTVTVTLHHGPDSTVLYMLRFQPQWTDALAILRRHDPFTVIGKIDTIARRSISLVDCEPA